MVVDTNILIAYLGGEAEVIKLLSEYRQRGNLLYLPAIVEAELLSFTKWTASEREFVETFLEENFLFIPIDRTLAQLSAEIRRTTKIKLPDALIAACTLFTNSTLLTRNKKDFKSIKGLMLMSI